MRFEPDTHAPSNRAAIIDTLVPSVHAQRAVVTQRKASCVPMGVEFETPLVFLFPAFAGEDDWACTLLDGPTMDFNVMTDRARWVASVAHRMSGVIDAPYVLALARGTFGGVALDAFDLVIAAEPGEATVPVLAISAAPRSVAR